MATWFIKVEQQFGATAARQGLCRAFAWSIAANSDPHRALRRLVVPGWYGVANVVADPHLSAGRRVLGKFPTLVSQLRGETIDGEVRWEEAAVALQLKSSSPSRAAASATSRHRS